MKSIPGIVFLIVGILVSVGLHEIGHLVPAKRFGVKVSQYFIGFGPTLWSKVIRGTEYGFKAIPLGGYVRMAGMVGPGRGDRVQVGRNGKLTIAEETRRASAEELAPGEESQAFWRLSAGKRLVIMCGGPLMNLLFAGILLTTVMVGIGSPVASNQLSTVTRCVSDKDVCSSQDPQAPGFEAGLIPGDVVIMWDGEPMSNWADVQHAIATGTAAPTSVEVEREGQLLSFVVTPVMTQRPVFDEAGRPVLDEHGEQETQNLPYVGIAPSYMLERRSMTEVPGELWRLTSGTAQIIAKLPADLWNTATSLVTGQERSQSGVVGIVGVADLAGSITSSESPEYSTVARTGDLLMLLASLNISLFIFNLIPLLPLDGGHILGACYEGGRRKIAALRGNPDPGPVDTARLMPLSYAVALAFIGMTLLLVIADIVNPVF